MAHLPIIRLTTAKPILDALEMKGVSIDPVFERVGLKREEMENEDKFVHANVMYQLMEEVARAADDLQFNAKIAQTMDITRWISFENAGTSIQTVGSLLTAFAIAATEHSSATQHILEVRSRRAILFGNRTFVTPFVPAQIDAFFAALLVSFIQKMTGSAWDAQEVLVTVSEPKALSHIFHSIEAVKGNRRGHRVQFPSLWLNQSIDMPEILDSKTIGVSINQPRLSMLATVRQALESHIDEPDLTVKRAAEICGMPYRSLARKLTSEGTTLRALLDEIKQQAAKKSLANTQMSITNIAVSIGYTNATSFTRAFKRWTGISPRAYRHRIQSEAGV